MRSGRGRQCFRLVVHIPHFNSARQSTLPHFHTDNNGNSSKKKKDERMNSVILLSHWFYYSLQFRLQKASEMSECRRYVSKKNPYVCATFFMSFTAERERERDGSEKKDTWVGEKDFYLKGAFAPLNSFASFFMLNILCQLMPHKFANWIWLQEAWARNFVRYFLNFSKERCSK